MVRREELGMGASALLCVRARAGRASTCVRVCACACTCDGERARAAHDEDEDGGLLSARERRHRIVLQLVVLLRKACMHSLAQKEAEYDEYMYNNKRDFMLHERAASCQPLKGQHSRQTRRGMSERTLTWSASRLSRLQVKWKHDVWVGTGSSTLHDQAIQTNTDQRSTLKSSTQHPVKCAKTAWNALSAARTCQKTRRSLCWPAGNIRHPRKTAGQNLLTLLRPGSTFCVLVKIRCERTHDRCASRKFTCTNHALRL
eukprot:2141772-Pleurochrysis_carterae.AAC.2